jgi:hypothetical protein
MLVAAAAVLALAFAASPAAAQEALPDDNAGTGQYIEPAPEAEGDRRAGSGPGGGRGRGGGGGGLPPEVRAQLPPGDEGRFLERLASEAVAAAHAAAGGDPASGGGDSRRGRGGSATPEEDPSAAGAASSALFDSDGLAVPLLVLALLALTAGAAAFRLRGRNRA